jgi:hypothetical protein
VDGGGPAPVEAAHPVTTRQDPVWMHVLQNKVTLGDTVAS